MSVKIREISKGKWGLKIDHKGKRKQVTIGSKGAAEKAKAMLELELAKDRLGILAKKTVPTFAAYSKNFLSFVRQQRAPKTYTRYKGLLDHHIYKHIGSKPLDQITRGDIRKLIVDVTEKGASRSSAALMLNVCNGIFLHAVEDELIVTAPTTGSFKRFELNRTTKEIQSLSAEEMNKALQLIDSTCYPLFLTLFNTGARIGEIAALEWNDIDFANRKIKISKSAIDQRVRNSTKTYLSRDVDISEELFSVLTEHKKSDKKCCFRLGIEQRYVFHKNGKLMSQNTLRRKWSKACQKIGIGHRRIHDIRHTTASILLMRNVPLLYVSRLLGHSSPEVTLRKYSHYLPSENDNFIDHLAERGKLRKIAE